MEFDVGDEVPEGDCARWYEIEVLDEEVDSSEKVDCVRWNEPTVEVSANVVNDAMLADDEEIV